jgi:hypothetical protein
MFIPKEKHKINSSIGLVYLEFYKIKLSKHLLDPDVFVGSNSHFKRRLE